MREIKFKFYLENSKSDIKTKIFDYSAVFSGTAKRYFFEQMEDYYILSKELYTGLKAKGNVKEIYEGDVVKWLDDYPICPKCINDNSNMLDLTLKFCPDCGAKIIRKDFYKTGEVIFQHSRWNFSDEYCEAITEKMRLTTKIIGNIHENPELL